MIRCMGQSILLGGDVKNGSETWGWDRILTFLDAERPTAIFKVAHHGDPKAHQVDLWANFLTPDCICIVAPYRPSKRPRLPDLARMKSARRQIYLTASPDVIAPSDTVTNVKANARFLKNVAEAGGITGQIRVRYASGRTPVVEEIGITFRA